MKQCETDQNLIGLLANLFLISRIISWFSCNILILVEIKLIFILKRMLLLKHLYN